jgi:hypothetical protein
MTSRLVLWQDSISGTILRTRQVRYQKWENFNKWITKERERQIGVNVLDFTSPKVRYIDEGQKHS